tara:strand:+ start:1604 stop:2248 length:645 start_codon:yes stop_codon:yes gene_type:complete
VNKFQTLILFAGLFQVFSQVSDQYVIQKENQIRVLENIITKQKDTMDENVNGNITYASIYTMVTKDVFLKLQMKNDQYNNEVLKKILKRNRNILYESLHFQFANPYINVEDPQEFLIPFNNIDKLINSNTDILENKSELISNFTPGTGLILNYFYEQNNKLEISISALENELRDLSSYKYFILVLGMIFNIISIIFILIFFYYILCQRKSVTVE